MFRARMPWFSGTYTVTADAGFEWPVQEGEATSQVVLPIRSLRQQLGILDQVERALCSLSNETDCIDGESAWGERVWRTTGDWASACETRRGRDEQRRRTHARTPTLQRWPPAGLR